MGIGANRGEVDDLFYELDGELLMDSRTTITEEYQKCVKYAERFTGGIKSVIVGKIVGKVYNYSEKRVDVFVKEAVVGDNMRGIQIQEGFIEAQNAEGVAVIGGAISPHCRDYAVLDRKTMRVLSTWRDSELIMNKGGV